MSTAQGLGTSRLQHSAVLLGISTAAMVALFITSIAKDFTLSTKELWSNDFQGFFLAAHLFARRMNPYTISNQLQAYAHYVPHIHGIGHVLFADAPLCLPVLLPFVSIPFRLGYLVLALLETAAFIAGLLFAIGSLRPRPFLTCCLLLGLPPVGVLILTGQWDGLTVLGLGIHFFLLQRKRIFSSGFVLGITACFALPHLIFGYAIYFLVRMRKPAVLSLACGVLASAVASIALTGIPIVLSFIVSVLTIQSHAFETGFAEILGHLLPATAADVLLACCITAAAIFFGRKARDEQYLLLATCVLALNILLNPHFFGQDLAIPLVAAAPLLYRALPWIANHAAQFVGTGILVIALLALITATQPALLPLQFSALIISTAVTLFIAFSSTHREHRTAVIPS